MELSATSNGTASDTDTVQPDATHDLDVREVPKPQRHPLIFARFDALAVGESFVLVNSHDPKHLHQEFDRDHPGTYDWQYLESGRADAADAAGSGRGAWRIRITRLIDGDLARLVGDIHALTNADTAGASDSAGAVWKLDVARRQLDANVIQLRPGGRIEAHTGPDLTRHRSDSPRFRAPHQRLVSVRTFDSAGVAQPHVAWNWPTSRG